MTARIKDFDPSSPRDYEHGCPVCGRSDVATDRGLVLGHACYPPFSGDDPPLIGDDGAVSPTVIYRDV